MEVDKNKLKRRNKLDLVDKTAIFILFLLFVIAIFIIPFYIVFFMTKNYWITTIITIIIDLMAFVFIFS